MLSRSVVQEMFKGMDPEQRAKMEEMLKNVRTGGGNGVFGALPPCASGIDGGRGIATVMGGLPVGTQQTPVPTLSLQVLGGRGAGRSPTGSQQKVPMGGTVRTVALEC